MYWSSGRSWSTCSPADVSTSTLSPPPLSRRSTAMCVSPHSTERISPVNVIGSSWPTIWSIVSVYTTDSFVLPLMRMSACIS